MLRVIKDIFKVPDIRNRVLFTLGMLILCRVGAQIPAPGIDLTKLLASSSSSGNPLTEMLNLFTGGALQRASIFSLGVMPYITSSIIMQVLTAVIPAIDQMNKEGPEGRKKIQQIGRVGTLAVALIQGIVFGRNLMLSSQNGGFFLTLDPGMFLFVFVMSVTAGTLAMMWIGEQITERGIGNGISLLIMIGIIARMPQAIYSLFSAAIEPINLLIVLALFAGVIGLVVFEEMGLRKLRVQYSKRYVAGGAYQGQSAFLPFKVNPTGVIPIIFASAFLMLPSYLAGLFPDNDFMASVGRLMAPSQWLYSLLYFLMIVFFAYFYMEIQLNPHDMAENLRKSGGVMLYKGVPVPSGKATEDRISYVLNRITLPGSMFLGAIALLPTFVIAWLQIPGNLAYLMGGTSLLITVGVALDTLRQLESHLMMHHREGFFNEKSKVRVGD